MAPARDLRGAWPRELVKILGTTAPGNIPTRVYKIATGLTGREAVRRAHALDRRAGYGDHRGATYDPRTGRATLT